MKSLRPSVKITRIGKPKRYHHVVGYLMHSHNNLYQMDMAAQIGPKALLQEALRRYTILTVGETILIENSEKR